MHKIAAYVETATARKRLSKMHQGRALAFHLRRQSCVLNFVTLSNANELLTSALLIKNL